MTILNEDKLIGIDLGGTKLNAGRIENGEIVCKKYEFIPSDSENEWDLINLIIEIIKELLVEGVNGIGIGIPSVVDRERGIVYEVQNIKSWKEVHLKEILESEFQIPVFLDNDANCFSLGEYRFGHANNCKSLVGLTIGTGMGAGIISGGHLIKDASGGAGEFGLIPYLDSNYEEYCSGQFFMNKYEIKGEEMAKLAGQGDENAIRAFKEFGKHLGNAIKTIKYAVDPNKVIIGGSVSKSHKYFESSMNECIEKFFYASSLSNFEIVFSNISDIAILGAASLYYDNKK